MSISDRIQSEIKQAMLSKDKETLQTLRMLSAALKQIVIDKQVELSDEIVLNELMRQVKQRKDALKQFLEAGREDLASKEASEIEVIERFLPRQLSVDEMKAKVDEIIATSGIACEKASMGQLMGLLKEQLHGVADMSAVSQYLREKLQ